MSEFKQRLAESAHRASAIDDPERGASWGALWSAGMYDDPGFRQKEFAKRRPPGTEYRADPETGQLAYREPGSQEWYLEEPSGFLPGLKSMAASAVGGDLPAAVGGVLGGFLGGPLGAVGGGMAGEGVAQILQNRFGGEPLGQQSLVDVGVAGLGGAAGEVAGAGLGAAARWANRARQGPAIGGFLQRLGISEPPVDRAVVEPLEAAGRQFGIDLTAPELMGDRQAIIAQQWLTDRPETSTKMGAFLDKREQQIRDAVEGYLDSLGGYGSPATGEARGAAAVNQTHRDLRQARQTAAEPHYTAARRDTADTSGVMENLGAAIANYPETSPVAQQLRRVQRMLLEETDDGMVPITDVQRLHGAKTTIDDMIESAMRSGDRNLARELTQAQGGLLDAMDVGSEAYRRGREVFRQESVPINALETSLAGKALGREGDPTFRLSQLLFGKGSDPYQIEVAREAIAQQNPEAWPSVVRAHLQRQFEEVLDPASGDVTNIGGMFRKKVFGNPRMRGQLEAALEPDQFRRLEDLMLVLEATGKSLKGQSATEIRQAMAKQVEEQSRGITGRLVRPTEAYAESEMRNRTNRTMQKLLDATLSPTSEGGVGFTLDRAARLIKQYGPEELRRRPKTFRAVLDVLGITGASELVPNEVAEQ